MVANDHFFGERQAAAILKHGILKRYPIIFAAMTGSRSKGGRVVYVDAFAGPGQYDDGERGSPLLAMDFARQSTEWKRKVECIFIEREKPLAATLQATLAREAGDAIWTVWNADVSDRVDEILDAAQNAPLFLFLDPFGTALPFETLARFLASRGRRPTEVLLNFNIEMLRRFGGIIRRGALDASDARILARMDAFLGSNWWHDVFADAAVDDQGAFAAAVEAVADEYRRQILSRTGYRSFPVPLRRQPNHVPAFHLTLFYRHDAAPWQFNDAVSLANQEWRDHFKTKDLAAAQSPLMGSLFDADGVEDPLETAFKDREARLTKQWVADIKENLLSVATPEGVELRSRTTDVFGKTLGQAREKHLRRAWDELATGGLLEPRRQSAKAYNLTLATKEHR